MKHISPVKKKILLLHAVNVNIFSAEKNHRACFYVSLQCCPSQLNSTFAVEVIINSRCRPFISRTRWNIYFHLGSLLREEPLFCGCSLAADVHQGRETGSNNDVQQSLTCVEDYLCQCKYTFLYRADRLTFAVCVLPWQPISSKPLYSLALWLDRSGAGSAFMSGFKRGRWQAGMTSSSNSGCNASGRSGSFWPGSWPQNVYDHK